MKTKKTPARKPRQTMTDKERRAEIKRLNELLQHGKFTVSELASIRGRIGGLVGAKHPGRRLGGIRGAEARWKNHRKASKRPVRQDRDQ